MLGAKHSRATNRILLRKVQEVIATGRHKIIADFEATLERKGDHELAALTRLMAAAQSRDAQAMEEIRDGDDGKLLRSEAHSHYILMVCLRQVLGIVGVKGEIGKVKAKAWEALPINRKRELVQMKVTLRTIGSRKPTLICRSDCDLPFLNGQSLLVIRISVNAGEAGYFILDTGAPTTLLSADFAARAGVKSDVRSWKNTKDGSGNSIRLLPAVARSVHFGGLTLNDVPVHIVRFPRALRVDGILSPQDALRGILMEVDMRTQRLRLSPGATLEQWRENVGEMTWGEAILWNDNVPHVRVRREKERSYFLLDTGAGANFICQDRLRAVEMKRLGSRLMSATAGRKAEVYTGFSQKIGVGDAPAKMERLMVKDCVEERFPVFPRVMAGYLGVPWFRGRRVAFAPDWRSYGFTEREFPPQGS